MTLHELNKQNREEVSKALMACCGSTRWVELLLKQFPFLSEQALVKEAELTWYTQCNETDWLESFSHHPKIGDLKSLTEKFAGKEQASVATAPSAVIQALEKANKEYEEKFGFIFIVCATGKPAEEMLRLMNDRIGNGRDEELMIAMGEQHKISVIRIKKLLADGNWQELKPSQLTTHVLDTTLGKPGKDITISLKQNIAGKWLKLAQGITNADGRIADLLPPGKELMPGNYKMVFETGAYFNAMNKKGFYPVVEIDFTVFDGSHYHVPLLINPFGYSTYRGS